jgi:hypothetical protein
LCGRNSRRLDRILKHFHLRRKERIVLRERQSRPCGMEYRARHRHPLPVPARINPHCAIVLAKHEISRHHHGCEQHGRVDRDRAKA